MKKKILFIAAAFVLSLVSCQKELSPAEENGNANTSTCITFTARFDATKTGFSEGKLTWEAGDKIAVCDGSTVETVTLTAENIKDEGVSAEITTTTLSDAAGKYYAVFPAGCAGSTASSFLKEGNIVITPGNINGGKQYTFKSYAVTTTAGGSFAFHNAGAIVYFETSREDIDHVTFSSNVYVKANMLVNPDTGEIAEDTINGGTAVTYYLNSEKEAYIPILAKTMNGFVLTAFDSTGETLGTITRETSITFKNGKYNELTNFDSRLLSPVVDLGLSVQWATCNLGASSPEKAGGYYAWGETEPKTVYSWSNYEWCKGTENTLTGYNIDTAYGHADGRIRIELSDDAANASLGGSWRIPSSDEWKELKDNCTWTWTTLNGKYGYEVKSNVEGYTDRSIFIPAVGYYDGSTLTDGTNGWYWTSDNKYGTYSNTARVYGLKPSDVGGYYGKKYVGNSVRPVKDDGTVKPSGISMRAYSHLTMFRGQTFDFNPTVLPENVDEDYQDITWNVTGPAISSSSQGKVYASSVGTGYVVAKTCDDLAVNCNVNVVDAYLLSSSGTANCYICSSKGTYRFKTVKGNSTESVGDVKGVKVLWKTFNNGSTPGSSDLIVDDNVWLSDEWIIFKTADTFQEGNVVIAAYSDEECTYGNILWSWHIWLTSANLTALQKTYSNSAGIMMDRNIGALKDNDDGMLYQWGRKDPFIPKYSYLDEDNDLTWGDMKSTAVWPSAVSKTSETCTLQYVTSNPMTFIKGSGSVGSEPFGYSWSSSKSMTDPCPPGWKVPNGGSASLWANAGIQSRNGWIEKGSYWLDLLRPYTNSSSYAKTSYYDSWSGTLSSPSWNSTKFTYWSNTLLSNTEASSFYVYFQTGDDDNYLTINTNYSTTKTYGYPVRCCKE